MQALRTPQRPRDQPTDRRPAGRRPSAWKSWASPGTRALAGCCGAGMLLIALAAEAPAPSDEQEAVADQQELEERQGQEQERLRRQVAERRHEQRLRARQVILSEMLKEVEIRREYLLGRTGSMRPISGTVVTREDRFALVRDGSYVLVVLLLTYRFRRWLFRGPYAWLARRRGQSGTTPE